MQETSSVGKPAVVSHSNILDGLMNESFRSQFRSPLCWRITAFVFGAIVLIEAIILVPSIANERRTLTIEREVTALAVARAALSITPDDAPIDAKIAALVDASVGTPLAGGTLFSADGKWLGTFGEIARPTVAETSPRYAVKWSQDQLDSSIRMVARLNTGDIGASLWDYVIDIAGLVLVISGFVTIATMYMLGRVLLRPLLELRINLQILANKDSEDRPHNMFSNKNDEWGVVVSAFNSLLDRLNSTPGITLKK